MGTAFVKVPVNNYENMINTIIEYSALKNDLLIAMREIRGGCKVCANRDAECVPGSGKCRPVWRGLCMENCEELEENKLRNDSL